MKRTACLLLIVFPLLARAQHSSPLLNPLPTPQEAASSVKILSDSPTAQELANALGKVTDGTLNPFDFIYAVEGIGDKAVPALTQLLSADSIFPDDLKPVSLDRDSLSVTTPPTPIPRELALLSLETIGTPLAYRVITEVAQMSRVPELRAASLTILGNSYYFRVCNGVLPPDKEVVHILLTNMDDTVSVGPLDRSLASIARDGLRSWLRMDFGLPRPAQNVVVVGKEKIRMSLSEYREYWWGTISPNITWNSKGGYFEIP
jgi:hypothetical protein